MGQTQSRQKRSDKSLMKIHMLTNAPILVLYDRSLYHEVHTDACSIGLAGVLLQSDDNQTWKPVMYFSRHCTDAERCYGSYELEVLAIVETLERFRLYLLGKPFRVVTDCAAIASTKEKTELKPRIARWWMKLLEYNFETVHREGTRLAHVDAMSRAPVDQPQEAHEIEFICNVNDKNVDWIAALQQRDERAKKIVHILMNKVVSDEEQQLKREYEVENYRLYRKTPKGRKLYVPRGVRLNIIKHYHEMGHFALERTLQRIATLFWFPKMRKLVKEFIKSCVACCFNKAQRVKMEAEMHFDPPTPLPFRTLHIDHVGPFIRSSKRNMYLLVVTDAFSKFCIIKAVRNTETKPVLSALAEIIGYFGLPEKIISDRGTAFTSKAFAKFCKDNNIRHVKTAVRTPRANGQVERANATVLNIIRTSSDGKTWDTDLGRIQWILNSTINATTKYSPNELVFSFNVNDAIHNHLVAAMNAENDMSGDLEPIEEKRAKALNNIATERERWKKRFDARCTTPRKYMVDDLVVIRNEPTATGESRKLEPKFRGPYVIAKVLGNDRYVIKDLPGSQLKQRRFDSVYAADAMKPWCHGYPEIVNDSDADEDSNGSNSEHDNELTDDEIAGGNRRQSMRLIARKGRDVTPL